MSNIKEIQLPDGTIHRISNIQSVKLPNGNVIPVNNIRQIQVKGTVYNK